MARARQATQCAGALLLFVWGCPAPTIGPTPTPVAQPALAPGKASVLTLLYTSDEHGWVQPSESPEVRRGGVSLLLHMLLTHEDHCAGAFPEMPAHDCSQSHTVLLSGGDNYTGPAISSHFRGETMAGAMRRLGYAAAAFGNHELDFGREQFEANREIAGMPYLSANLVKSDGTPHDLVKSHVILERGSVRLAVVGLTTQEAPKTATAHRFEGMRFDPPEATLARVVPEMWQAGADAVVVIAHECHDVIAPIIARHPEWRLSFVGTGHCHRTSVEYMAGTPVIGPDWRMEHYARVKLSFDPDKPPGERATVVDYELMEVASPSHVPAPTSDPELDTRIAGWQAEIERQLGEVIGYSSVGLAKNSTALGHWVVSAWRERFGVDVAVTTRGSIRQDLPPGPITMADIASIMPFENELVVCSATGAELGAMLASPETLYAGVRKSDKGFTDAGGKPLDPAKRYTIVTTDFLFHGGDGLTFHLHDPAPKPTGVNWREPVVAWTKSHATSRKKPLESLLMVGP